QAYVWPTTPRKGRQALLGTWSETTRTGFGLGLDAAGALALRLGDGTRVDEVSTGVALLERKWCFVGASFDAASGVVHLYQEPLSDHTLDVGGPVHVERRSLVAPRLEPAAFRMAAWHQGQQGTSVLAGGHFNGKLDRPRLASRALGRAEMAS